MKSRVSRDFCEHCGAPTFWVVISGGWKEPRCSKHCRMKENLRLQKEATEEPK